MNDLKSSATSLAKGLTAAVVASFVASRVDAFFERHIPRKKKATEDWRRVRSFEKAAVERVASAAGIRLNRRRRKKAVKGLERVLQGAVKAATIGARTKYFDMSRLSSGLLFGLTSFLVFEEVGKPLLGITHGPRAYPLQTHLQRFSNHVTYGLVNSGVRKMLHA